MINQAKEYSHQLYKELSRIGKGLGSDRRLEILDLLSQSSKSVEAISKEVGISIANTSRHLQTLKQCHLVKTERDGNHIIYSLSSPKIIELVHLLIDIGEEELSEMHAIEGKIDSQENVKTISLEKARQDYKNGILLDVRPSDEYQTDHIKTSINIPFNSLKDKLDLLPKDRPIIVYCRGRLCANSNIATHLLNQNGFDAYSLNVSLYDWKKAVN